MNTITDTNVLDDARIIALATVADAGGLMENNVFEDWFAPIAMNGARAVYFLGVNRKPASVGNFVEALEDLSSGERRTLIACARHHRDEYGKGAASALEDGEAELVASYREEVTRAERVLKALGTGDFGTDAEPEQPI